MSDDNFKNAQTQTQSLKGLISGMETNQKQANKYTSGQLNKVNKQLEDLNNNQTINATTKTKTFNAVASIGSNLQSQASNLKSNDPIRVTTGVLTLVSGVAMCFGPPVGVAIGAITGLVAGVMSLLAEEPKPTMTEVIGNMINEQTKQIANMLQQVSDHFDDKIDALSEQIRDEFKNLIKGLNTDFEKLKQFIETQLVVSGSSGTIAMLMDNLVAIKGFIAGYDENTDKLSTVTFMTQVNSTAGVEQIGILRGKIEEKLIQLKEIIKADNTKVKDLELYWQIHNYTIQMTVALINLYVIISSYRYIVLANLCYILDAANDSTNANVMNQKMKAMRDEGKTLLEFIAKPQSKEPQQIIISGYIRNSRTSSTINAYLRFCSNDKFDLLSYVPKFDPNTLYAVENVKNPNNILVTGGVVNQHAFVSASTSVKFDASVNNYSLYYKLQAKQDEPWKINFVGYKISFDGYKINLMQSTSIDYNNTLLIAMDTDVDEKKDDDESSTFILLTKADPGNLLTIKSKDDEKDDEKDIAAPLLATSLIQPFDHTKNFQNNDAVFKLVLPKTPINNLKDIIPNSESIKKYNPDPMYIAPIKEPKYTTIKHEVAKQIKDQNVQIVNALKQRLQIDGVKGQHFSTRFNRSDQTKSGKQLAIAVEDAAINLITIRGEMRRNAQLVYEILSYKVGNVDDEKRKKYWPAVLNSCLAIIKAVTETLAAAAEFAGFLLRFSQSFQNVITGQKEPNETDRESLSKSMEWLTDPKKGDLFHFDEWLKAFKITMRTLQTEIETANVALMTETIGHKQIQKNNENLVSKQNKYNEALNIIRSWKIKQQKEMEPIRVKIMNLDISIEQDQAVIDYYNGKITNLDSELKRIGNLSSEYDSELLKKDCTDSFEEVNESGWWVFKNKKTKTIKSNRRSNILAEQKKIKEEFKDNKLDEETSKKKRLEVEQRMQQSVILRSNADRQLKDLEDKWKKNLKTKNDNVQSAANEMNNAVKEIDEAIIKTGQSKKDLVDFLSITANLGPANVRTITATAKLQASMTTLFENWKRQCTLTVSVEEFCIETTISTTVSEILIKNKYENMVDLDYENEAQEYKAEIEEAIFVKNKIEITRGSKKALRKAATDPNGTWIKDIRKKNERKVRKILLASCPILRDYMIHLNEIIRNASNQLQVELFEGSNDRLSNVKAIPSLPAIELPGPIIEEVSDDDDGDDGDDGDNGDELKIFFNKLNLLDIYCYDLLKKQGLQNVTDLEGMGHDDLTGLGITKFFDRKRVIEAVKAFE
eukprot:388754_1